MPTEWLQERVSLSPKTYLTYDDVLLLPAYSEVTPPETSLGGVPEIGCLSTFGRFSNFNLIF